MISTPDMVSIPRQGEFGPPRRGSEQIADLLKSAEHPDRPEIKTLEKQIKRTEAWRGLLEWNQREPKHAKDEKEKETLKLLDSHVPWDKLMQSHTGVGSNELITEPQDLLVYLKDAEIFLQRAQEVDPLLLDPLNPNLDKAYQIIDTDGLWERYDHWRFDETLLAPERDVGDRYIELAQEAKQSFPAELDSDSSKDLAVTILDGYRAFHAVDRLKNCLSRPANREIQAELVRNSESLKEIFSSPLFSEEALSLAGSEIQTQKEKARMTEIDKALQLASTDSTQKELELLKNQPQGRLDIFSRLENIARSRLDTEVESALGLRKRDLDREENLIKRAKKLSGTSKNDRDARYRYGKRLDEFAVYIKSDELGSRFNKQLYDSQFVEEINRKLQNNIRLSGGEELFITTLHRWYPTLAQLREINPADFEDKGGLREKILKAKHEYSYQLFGSYGPLGEENRTTIDVMLDRYARSQMEVRKKQLNRSYDRTKQSITHLADLNLDAARATLPNQRFEERIDVQEKMGYDLDYYLQGLIEAGSPKITLSPDAKDYHLEEASRLLHQLAQDIDKLKSTLLRIRETQSIPPGMEITYQEKLPSNEATIILEDNRLNQPQSITFADEYNPAHPLEIKKRGQKKKITLAYDRATGRVKRFEVDSQKSQAWEDFTFKAEFHGDETRLVTDYNFPPSNQNHIATYSTFHLQDESIDSMNLEWTKHKDDVITRENFTYPPDVANSNQFVDLPRVLTRMRDYILLTDRSMERPMKLLDSIPENQRWLVNPKWIQVLSMLDSMDRQHEDFGYPHLAQINWQSYHMPNQQLDVPYPNSDGSLSEHQRQMIEAVKWVERLGQDINPQDILNFPKLDGPINYHKKDEFLEANDSEWFNIVSNVSTMLEQGDQQNYNTLRFTLTQDNFKRLDTPRKKLAAFFLLRARVSNLVGGLVTGIYPRQGEIEEISDLQELYNEAKKENMIRESVDDVLSAPMGEGKTTLSWIQELYNHPLFTNTSQVFMDGKNQTRNQFVQKAQAIL